jgi:DNA-binding MarR family transcriptional regulator
MSKSRKQHIEEIMEMMHSIRRTFVSQWGKSQSAKMSSQITPSQWIALTVVARKEQLSITELAETLGVSASAATQLVNELVIKGHLIREGKVSDRRTILLTLTESAKKKINELKSKQLDKFVHAFDGLTDKEIEQYAALNKKISEYILHK